MFKQCPECKNIRYIINPDKIIRGKPITFSQWRTVVEEKIIKNKPRKIRKTMKKEISASFQETLDLLNTQLIAYQKHIFIMKHQMTQLQNRKREIEKNEIIIQIDFSENYVTKYSTEIQSMHFGASKKQLSLHTGLFYTSDKSKGICFCSVSENLDHQSHAIWAHMNDILIKLASEYPNVTTINIFSDGPTSQYRNRSNIYFFLKKIPSIFKNIVNLSWNCSESGHGKGPMDGVGML